MLGEESYAERSLSQTRNAKGWWQAWICVSLIAATSCFALSPVALAQSPNADSSRAVGIVSVYRGVWPVGQNIWLELIQQTDGQYKLFVLDGDGSSNAYPLVIDLTQQSRRRNQCSLVSDRSIQLDACPTEQDEAFTANLRWNNTGNALVTMHRITPDGSFVFRPRATGAPRLLGEIPSRCTLSSMTALPDGVFSQTRVAARSLRDSVSDFQPVAASSLDSDLSRLRRERWLAYEVLPYTPEEQARIDRFSPLNNLGRRGTGMDWNSIARGNEAQNSQRAMFDNRPQRVAARRQIERIDQRLAEIYNPNRWNEQARVLAWIRDTGLPLLEQSLGNDLQLNQPNSEQLWLAGRAVANVDRCAEAVGSDRRFSRTMHESLIRSASGILPQLTAELEQAGNAQTAAAGRSVLERFQPGSVLHDALRASGDLVTLSVAETRLQQLAAREQEQAAEAERRALAAREAETRRQQAAAERAAAEQARALQAEATTTGPSSRSIQDAIVYEQAYGVTTAGETLGMMTKMVEFSSGTIRYSMMDVIDLETTYLVTGSNCSRYNAREFRCSFNLNRTLMGTSMRATMTHNFQFIDGRWRSATYRNAIIEAAQSAPSSSGSDTNGGFQNNFGRCNSNTTIFSLC